MKKNHTKSKESNITEEMNYKIPQKNPIPNNIKQNYIKNNYETESINSLKSYGRNPRKYKNISLNNVDTICNDIYTQPTSKICNKNYIKNNQSNSFDKLNEIQDCLNDTLKRVYGIET